MSTDEGLEHAIAIPTWKREKPVRLILLSLKK